MAGEIPNYQGSLSVNFKSQTPVNNTALNTAYNIAPSLKLTLPFQNLGANNLPTIDANQEFLTVDTVAASGTDPIDLSAAVTNTAGNAAATFDKLSVLILYLPALTDPEAVRRGITEQASSVTIGNAASNAWSALLGATGTVTLKPGHALVFMDLSGVNALAIDSSHKLLKVLNNDSVNQANLLRYMVGKDN